MKNYLALDIGTTNWKAAVFTEKGTLLGIERCPTKTHTNAQGNSYYNPIELWESVTTLIKAVIAKTNATISAISVTSMAEAVVAIDEQGNPVGDIIAWFDTRSMQEAQWLADTFTKEKLFSITGLDVNPIFSLPKILWVRKHQPEIYEKAKKWLQMADFMLMKLTGEFVTDYTFASRTLAFDVLKNEWSSEILNAVQVDVATFPTIVESGTVVGTLLPATAQEIGLPSDVKVVMGGNDHPCAAIVAGAVDGNKILDSSGTAESFIYISKKHEVPNMVFNGQRICRFLQKDRYALWGGIICSGRSFDWGYSLFGEGSYEETLKSIADTEAMQSGLIFYPHLRGAGAPHWNPKISGSYMGIRDYHTKEHMLKAVLEGLSFQARMIVEMHENVSGVTADSLCVVGGGSRNRLWQHIKANITQKPVEISDESEATALGAAMLAAIGDGVYEGIEEASAMLAKNNLRITPDTSNKELYDTFYSLYKMGYDSQVAYHEAIYKAVKG